VDAGRETYLDVKGSGDPTLGEESALVGLKRKSSEILLFEVLVGRVNGHHKIYKNDWEISCRYVRNFFSSLVVFTQLSRTVQQKE
jgi:hypothetical protein